MGLSSLPTPSEGLLSILLQTAFSISFFKTIALSILDLIGIGILSSSSSNFPTDYVDVELSSDYTDFQLPHTDIYIGEFHRRMPAVRFDRACKSLSHDLSCSICLTQFEAESEINLLSCGHIFHQVCLEKWLEYWNTSCPVCRTPLLPEEDRSSSC